MRHQEVFELAHRRSNLLLHLHFHVLQKFSYGESDYAIAVAQVVAGGLTLTCRGLKLLPLVIIAQRTVSYTHLDVYKRQILY